jgi:hypothetical protein
MKNKFVLLHTNNEPYGTQEVLVNLSNVLFIQPNHAKVGGCILSFHAVEGHIAGDLWVTEDFVEFKQGYCL